LTVRVVRASKGTHPISVFSATF